MVDSGGGFDTGDLPVGLFVDAKSQTLPLAFRK